MKCLQVERYEVIGYKNGATSLYLAKRECKDLVYGGEAGTGYQQLYASRAGKKPLVAKFK